MSTETPWSTEAPERETHTEVVPRSKAMLRPKIRNTAWIVAIGVSVGLFACLGLGLSIGSPEVLLITFSSMLVIWLSLKAFFSRGKFRFASILVLTAVIASLASFFIPPMKAKLAQRRMIARVLENGGDVQVFAFSANYFRDRHLGWTQTRSGWMCPSILAYFYDRYLMPDPIGNVTLPSRVLDQETLDALNMEHDPEIRVLLNGPAPSNAFHSFVTKQTFYFSDLEYVGWYHDQLSFQVLDLKEEEVKFVERCQVAQHVFEIDDRSSQLRHLRSTQKPLTLHFTNMPKNVTELQAIGEIPFIRRIVIDSLFLDAELFQAIELRAEPIDCLHLLHSSLKTKDWEIIAQLKKVRSLILFDTKLNGKPMTLEDFSKLAGNQGIESFTISSNSIHTDPELLRTLVTLPNLRQVAILNASHFEGNDLELIRDSKIDVLRVHGSQLTTPLNALEYPWIRRMKIVQVNDQVLGNEDFVTGGPIDNGKQ